jgi:hypothetical protein
MNEHLKVLAEQANLEIDPAHVDHNQKVLEKYFEMIVRMCIVECDAVASDARAMTQSQFVTDSGRMLHEGMWGGAKNSIGAIKRAFNLVDPQP